jgi:hypothetical protein
MTSQTYSTGKIILGNYTRNSHYMYRLEGIANTSSNTRFCISYTTPPVTHNPYSVQPGHMQTTLVDFPLHRRMSPLHSRMTPLHSRMTPLHSRMIPLSTAWSHGRSHDGSHGSFFPYCSFFTNTGHLSAQPHHMYANTGHMYANTVTCMHSHSHMYAQPHHLTALPPLSSPAKMPQLYFPWS